MFNNVISMLNLFHALRFIFQDEEEQLTETDDRCVVVSLLIKLLAVVGMSVVTVVATDADDPTYGNSARLIYSILQGQPYFSVEPKTGQELLAEQNT